MVEGWQFWVKFSLVLVDSLADFEIFVFAAEDFLEQ